MRITTRGRYALRATLALAQLGDAGQLVSIQSIAQAENLSPIFLEQIFFNLKKAGIVRSVRGPGGGFTFTVPLVKLSVMEILEAAGEVLTAGNCDKHAGICDRQSGCKAHRVWVQLSKVIKDYFHNMTLADLLEDGVEVMDNSIYEFAKN